jgi:hypothetical protein
MHEALVATIPSTRKSKRERERETLSIPPTFMNVTE